MSSNNPAMTQWINTLKSDIDIHQVAERLGLQRDGSKGNYRAPGREDKHHSLSLHKQGQYGQGWKDHATGSGGTTIDLVLYAEAAEDFMSAARLLGGWFGLPAPITGQGKPRQLTKIEYIAQKCRGNTEPALDYLVSRGISPAVVQAAIKRRTIGFNDWTSPKLESGQPGYGGAAAAFMVYNANGECVAVDLRYIDADANGGVKTQCQGEKDGFYWTSCPRRLAAARAVYIVESPINALSIETALAHHAGFACLAIRGVANVGTIDWAFLRGKKAIIALDHTDKVNDKTGQRPGMAAAFQLYDALTAADISARMVDMLDWQEGEDINDVLQIGTDELQGRLKQIDQWLISGMPSTHAGEAEKARGRRRVFLPGQDWSVYWRYRVMDDFMQYVDEFKDHPGDAEDEPPTRSETLGDLCSFRLAALSRLSIQSHLSTINGTRDSQPETVYGISAQTPRGGNKLQREVINGDKIYNLDWWKSKFGMIWKPAQFTRMLTIMERSTELAAKDVVNFVGLAWRDGKLAALEGQDCFFIEPQKQCLYYNMSFPRGTQMQAQQVVQAYQSTFKQNAACIAMVWALGCHLKAVLGFYPHFQMQAEKGSGKSKLLESLQSSLAFQVLSGQMLKTDHRRRASVSYTSHPVGWDEYSKLPKGVLTDIDGLLQSTYRFEFTRVGAALTPYLMCSPVLLAGEEVDVASLQSKICRSTLAVKKQGDIIAHDLPQFPVWQWLQYLSRVEPARIRDLHSQYLKWCQSKSRSGEGDATAKRMMENYAAIATAWAFLADFAGFPVEQGAFLEDLMVEMNQHLSDTDGTRLPWVWIMEIFLSELEAKRFEHPFCWDRIDGQWALLTRPNYIMDHISSSNHLRDKFNALPIKTGRIFKQQLMASGVVMAGHEDIERVIQGRRTAHLTAISLDKLEKLGLYATPWQPSVKNEI
jgi:hypothetical protein